MIEINFFFSPFFFYDRFRCRYSTLYWKISSSEWCGSTINRRNIIILFRFGNNTSNKLYNFFGEYPTRICCYKEKRNHYFIDGFGLIFVVYWILVMFRTCSSQFVVCNSLFWCWSIMSPENIYIEFTLHTQTPYKKSLEIDR